MNIGLEVDINQEMREFYNRYTGYFEHMRTHHDFRYFEPFLKILENNGISLKNKRILDVGSGTGEFITIIQTCYEGPFLAMSVDISFIGAKMHRHGFPVNGDATNLPFKSNSFDMLFMIDVLERIPEPPKALQEAYRVIEKSGYILIRTPNYRCPVLSPSPTRELANLLRRTLFNDRSIGTFEQLTPPLSLDTMNGNNDAASAILADVLRDSFEQLGGEIIVYETWAGMGWRFPILRIFNKTPLIKHLGGTCTILSQKVC